MASVKKRPDGTWRARYRDPAGREHARHFARKVDAERWLTTVEASKLTGNYVDPSAGKVTFKAYAEKWRKIQVHREGTATQVEMHLRLHVYPTIGERPIASIRQSEIQALVQRAGATLAASTVEVVYGRVVAVFRAAVRDKLIVATPCVDVRLPAKKPASMLEVLSTEQVVALADAMPDRYRAVVLVGAGTGLRPGELFGLTVDRIDFLRGTLRVDQQLVRRRRSPNEDESTSVDSEGVELDEGPAVELGPLKTKASYRTVPLAQAVVDVLAAHLATWPAHAELGLVFTNAAGDPIQQHPFSVVWEDARVKAGLPEWATPHDLRHYFASVLIRSGASVKVIQARLGHSSAKTTLDVYGHLFEDEEDRTRAAIDGALGAAADSTRTEQTG